jgi:hypothetical protein
METQMGWPKGRLRGPRKPPPEVNTDEIAAPAVAEPVEPRPVKTASAPKKKWVMKAGANWENVDGSPDNPDRLHIPANLFPEGMSLQWITESVYGQAFPQRMSNFERKGWTVVDVTDFDGRFDGMFMPKGASGPIRLDGLVLCARPMELTEKALREEKRQARERIAIKEAALTGGQMEGVSGASDPSAVRFNHIRRSMEQIEIPKE